MVAPLLMANAAASAMLLSPSAPHLLAPSRARVSIMLVDNPEAKAAWLARQNDKTWGPSKSGGQLADGVVMPTAQQSAPGKLTDDEALQDYQEYLKEFQMRKEYDEYLASQASNMDMGPSQGAMPPAAQNVKFTKEAAAVAYGSLEALYWVASVPLCAAAWNLETGQFPDISDRGDMALLFAGSFALANLVRLFKPFRIWYGVQTIPFVQAKMEDYYPEDDYVYPPSYFNAMEMPGVTEPLGFWDPIGFTEDKSEAKVKFYREAELKHGRVAMLAAPGFLLAEHFHPLFTDVDVPSVFAFEKTHITTIFLLAVGALEGQSIFTFQPPWKDFWTIKPSHSPGDFGFDPLGLKPDHPLKFREMQNKELNNGRCAPRLLSPMYGRLSPTQADLACLLLVCSPADLR